MSVTKTEIESGIKVTYGDKSDLMTLNEIAETNKVTADNMNQIKGAINNASSIMAEMLEEFNSQFTSVATRLDNLEYKAITISAFTIASPAAALETGSSFNAITINYTLSKQPTKVELLIGSTVIADITSSATSVSSKSVALNRTITTNTTFTLRVTDGKTTATKNAAIAFYYNLYYGVSTASSITDGNTIKALSHVLLTDTNLDSVVINVPGATDGKYIWIALPDGTPTPAFYFNNLTIPGGANAAGTVTISNTYGVNKTYKLYRSDNAGLGGSAGNTIKIEIKKG